MNPVNTAMEWVGWASTGFWAFIWTAAYLQHRRTKKGTTHEQA